jgi:dTDP-4-dehydrorhamnose reductase
MRAIVIGAGGFLGGRLIATRDPRFQMFAANRNTCDITDPVSVRAAFDEARPQVAVLAAAIADIDRCEKQPDLAWSVNVGGVENVAKECARAGVRLLFTSSGAIFDGTAEQYSEADPPTPLSVYAKTKAAAERAALKIVPSAVILRLSMALGYSVEGGTNASLDVLEAALRSGNSVYAPAEEYRNAIDVETLSRWILDLACAPEATGIFHLGSSDAMSRYEIVSRLAEAMGYSQDLVIARASPPGRAPRGRRQLLAPARIKEHSAVPVPTCMQAIERCLHVPA